MKLQVLSINHVSDNPKKIELVLSINDQTLHTTVTVVGEIPLFNLDRSLELKLTPHPNKLKKLVIFISDFYEGKKAELPYEIDDTPLKYNF